MSIQFKYSCISKKGFILICAIFAWTWSVHSILDLWGTYLPYSSWFENQLKRIVYELLKGALNGNILTMVNAHEFMKRQLQLSMIPSFDNSKE